MRDKKNNDSPKTQHSKIYGQDKETVNNYTVLDSPDDRITKQDGNGVTLVTHDNPDDVESGDLNRPTVRNPRGGSGYRWRFRP